MGSRIPKFVKSMLANPYRGQALEGYAFEPKCDGWRAEFIKDRQWHWRLLSREGRDMTDEFPELEQFANALRKDSIILDGELLAIGRDGMAQRALLNRGGRFKFRSQLFPTTLPPSIVYIIFDVLWYKRRSLMAQQYHERRALLQSLKLKGPSWETIVSDTDFEAVARAVIAGNFEGIVAKRLMSTYRPGSRTNDWLKIKHPQAA